MSITTISDNERRLLGENKVLRDLLLEAFDVIDTIEGECADEQAGLDGLKGEIQNALRAPAEFMPNQPLAPVAYAQAATKQIAKGTL